VFALLIVGVIALGIKAAFYKRQVSGRTDREVRGPAYKRPAGRHRTEDVEDELDRLKREMGN
jgi:hypothetical protein